MSSGYRTNRESLVIGLDCSTTGTKAIAVNNIGGIAAATYCCNFAKKTTERLFSQVIDDRLEILGACPSNRRGRVSSAAGQMQGGATQAMSVHIVEER